MHYLMPIMNLVTRRLPLTVSPHRHIVAVVLVVSWLVGMVFAFWWFQYRYVQPFVSKHTVFFDSSVLRSQLAALVTQMPQSAGVATVVHFYNPGCACNRFNEAHVRELITRYGAKGVRFVIAVEADSIAHRGQVLAQAKKVFDLPSVIGFRLAGEMRPPSSPAVAVLDARGQLAYFGPYSIGAVCSASNGAFVETALDKLIKGNNPAQVNTLAVGCFCPWPSVVTQG